LADDLFSGTGRQGGIGRGPLASVLRAGVQIITKKSPVFNLGGDYYQPSFLSVLSNHRVTRFWIAGFWSAVHLITLLLTPDPISPWLFYAAVYGKEGIPTDLAYIRALDPASAKILGPWFTFAATDCLDGDLLGPIHQLLVTYLEIHEVLLHCHTCCYASLTWIISSVLFNKHALERNTKR
jgi:hypothetical protein